MPEPCHLVAAYDAAAEAMRRHAQYEGCEDCLLALRRWRPETATSRCVRSVDAREAIDDARWHMSDSGCEDCRRAVGKALGWGWPDDVAARAGRMSAIVAQAAKMLGARGGAAGKGAAKARPLSSERARELGKASRRKVSAAKARRGATRDEWARRKG